MFLIKILLALTFLIVFIQDDQDRLVYWFLFPTVAASCGTLFYLNTLPELFLAALVVNLSFVLMLILSLMMYSRVKLKTNISNTIGIGDLFLFVALTFSFTSLSFVILFVCALVFSFGLHLCRNKSTSPNQTVPLAGYMSLFFFIIYVTHWIGILPIVYQL